MRLPAEGDPIFDKLPINLPGLLQRLSEPFQHVSSVLPVVLQAAHQSTVTAPIIIKNFDTGQRTDRQRKLVEIFGDKYQVVCYFRIFPDGVEPLTY